MNHGCPTQRSSEPEVKGKGDTVEQLITRSGLDGWIPTGKQNRRKLMLVLMLKRKLESKAAGRREGNRDINHQILSIHVTLPEEKPGSVRLSRRLNPDWMAHLFGVSSCTKKSLQVRFLVRVHT